MAYDTSPLPFPIEGRRSYDFETRLDRSLEGSAKWALMYEQDEDVQPGVVPFSIADMEFRTAPQIVRAIQETAAIATLGYTQATDDYLDAVLGWQFRRHSWTPSLDWLVQTPGVVDALFTAVKAFTQVGDGVIIQTPVYPPFYRCVLETGRRVVENPLLHEEGRYLMDFEGLAELVKDPSNRLLILCSPHNPVGRVWTEGELRRLVELCIAHDVFIVSDEIHDDLIMPGCRHGHTTIMKVMKSGEFEWAMTCTAPSKSFNIAGLQCSNIFIQNPRMRSDFTNELAKSGFHSLNALAYRACQVAYDECEGWLEELIAIVWENYQLVREHLAASHPWVKVTDMEGTYLAWLDLTAAGRDPKAQERILRAHGLFFDEGPMFGDLGRGFERWNLACPTSVIEEALPRLDAALRELER